MGINCGVIGINIAHELGHRSKWYEIVFAKALLVSSLYYQFYIDHNKGHHKYVSTPDDPASARLNEPLYTFLVRSIIGTFKSSWKIDKSETIKGLFFELILTGIITFTFGLEGTLYFICSATIGFILLECVNYLEHYGLERKKNPSGRYEKITPKHSWNSNHLIGRGVLFNLSRHSDHHYKSSKKYQILDYHDISPQVPFGYPTSMVMSFFPPLWFKVMNQHIPEGMKPD